MQVAGAGAGAGAGRQAGWQGGYENRFRPLLLLEVLVDYFANGQILLGSVS